MTLDPFSMGTHKFCDDCAFLSIKGFLKLLMNQWPAGVPEDDVY